MSPEKRNRLRQHPRTAKMVTTIAFEGSVLALNAALESARAGEAGEEFSLVAEEVRSLARRCARAARETASLMETSAAGCKPRPARGFAQIVKAISQMELATTNNQASAAQETAGHEHISESEILRSLASRLSNFAGSEAGSTAAASQA